MNLIAVTFLTISLLVVLLPVVDGWRLYLGKPYHFESKDTTCDTSLTGQTLLRRRKGLVTCLTSSCALEVLMHHLTSPVWIISKIFEESKVQE